MQSLTRRGEGSFNLTVLICFFSLFLLLANCRMDSGDANAQLQATLNLVRTGSLGMVAPNPDPLIQKLNMQSPSGRYYEAHDIGNSLLMAPSAATAVALSKAVPRLRVDSTVRSYSDPSLILAKVMCSLTDTVISAIATYFLYMLFVMFLSQRMSLGLALLFAFGTYFAGYFRSSWDVVPTCDACCILVYFLVRMAAETKPRASTPVWAAFWLGVTGSFRYSLLPFLGLSVTLIFWQNRKRFTTMTYLLSIATLVVVLVPTMIYNQVRMGSPIKPATMAPQFADQNGLTSNLIPGALGLVASPNRGILVFSPILLLMLALPSCWKSIPAPVRQFLVCLAPGVFLYYLLISRLRNWGAAGWGPRYMLPILPILFLATGFTLAALWNRGRLLRSICIALIAISASVTVPAILVDYTDAIRMDPQAIDSWATTPRQIVDTWRAFGSSITGRPAQVADDQTAPTVFPDLAVTRVANILGKKSKVIEILFALIYVALIGWIIWLLFSRASSTHGDGINSSTAENVQA
jgi:hypothetical protein